MEVRPATPDDLQAISDTARRSLEASYALSPAEIDLLLEEWFTEDALESRLDADDQQLLVVEPPDDLTDDLELAGFVLVRPDNSIRWLHVHPEARGRGTGTAMLDAADDALDGPTASLEIHVLELAREGDTFLEQFDYEHVETTAREIGGERFNVDVYADADGDAGTDDSSEVPDSVDIDGDRRTVRESEALAGTDGEFYPVYESEAANERLGYICGNCATVEVVADGLDRLECQDCGNVHRAEEWDPAYI